MPAPAPDAAPLDAATVGEAMNAPVVSCHADTPFGEVAELMTRHRIHAVVVVGDGGGDEPPPPRVVSEMDLVRALATADDATQAGTVAAVPAVTVTPDEPLRRAAVLMSVHGTTHVVVVADGHPVGVVSALDVAARAVPPVAPAAAPSSSALRAAAGDRLVIRGHHLGERERDAEILEVRGADGGPPFLVRWEDSGSVTLLYPGTDARVHHLHTGS